MISVIVPCFNEQEALPHFYKETTSVFAGMATDYELIFVNDGSSDATLPLLKKLASEDDHVK